MKKTKSFLAVMLISAMLVDVGCAHRSRATLPIAGRICVSTQGLELTEHEYIADKVADTLIRWGYTISTNANECEINIKYTSFANPQNTSIYTGSGSTREAGTTLLGANLAAGKSKSKGQVTTSTYQSENGIVTVRVNGRMISDSKVDLRQLSQKGSRAEVLVQLASYMAQPIRRLFQRTPRSVSPSS